MTRASVVFGFIVALGLSVGMGIWVSAPAADSSKVAVLERKLHEAETKLVLMSRQVAAGGQAAEASTAEKQASLLKQEARSMASVLPVADRAENASAEVPKQKTLDPDDDTEYDIMVGKLGLAPVQQQAFAGITKNRSKAREDAFARLRDPSLSKEQRQAILADTKGKIAQMDDSLRQLLGGDSNFDTYNGWQAEGHERNEIRSARAIFQNAGDPLNSQQESWLTDTLYGLRKDSAGLGDPYSLDMLGGRPIGNAYLSRSLDKFDGDTQALMQNAQQQFSPAQLRALNAVRASQRTALEAQILILARTTGGH